MTQIVVERDVPVPMRDGVVLRADVWRPVVRGRVPVLLQRTPYDKAVALMAHAPIDPATAVEAGYGVVIQDVRGRFASDGAFEPFRQELADGVDTVRWAASLPWSTGWVGTYGASYVGATQLLAAVGRPAGLAAMVPWVTASEYYEGWTYQGGAFQLGFALHWASGLAGGELARRRARGDDVDTLERELDALVREPWNAYVHLPLTDRPVLRELAPFFAEWLRHPSRDSYWCDSAIADRYAAVDIPALHVGGWNDIFVSGTLRNFTGLRDAGSPGQRLLVGPWAHGTMGEMIGDVSYGPDGSRWSLDATALHLDFFADVHAGRLGDRPPVRVFVLGENRWRDQDDWPPPGATIERLYLRADGGLGWEPPRADEPPDEYVYDPRGPVPTAGGQTLLPGHEISIMLGQRDQTAVESRADVLVYRSAPLERRLEIAGHVSLVLYAATSAVDTDWTARLVDVEPGGRAIGVVDGILRARFRNGLESEELLEPGRGYRFEVEVGDTCLVLEPGHRLGLQVSSSNFPRFDRNPNTGGVGAEALLGDLRSARQTVFHDAERASYLLLPISPG